MPLHWITAQISCIYEIFILYSGLFRPSIKMRVTFKHCQHLKNHLYICQVYWWYFKI